MRGAPHRAGVCFSTVAPKTRSEGERLFAVFEWGNTCTHVTEFLVPPGIVLWTGQVHPGDPRACLGQHFGIQVFVENPAAQRLIWLRTQSLIDDLGAVRVYTGRSGNA